MIKTRKIDAVIKDGDNIVFEKKDFEIPEGWSDRAGIIMASKYAMDSENSAIQIIDRVVNQITKWGVEQGYFNKEPNRIGEEVAEEFMDSLKDILLNQRAAFNSPVWFNVGSDTKTNQCSACQPYWALINTEKGLLPIGHIVENNMVGLSVQHGGKITAVKHNGKKKWKRIHTKSGHILEVTADHLVYSNQYYNEKIKIDSNSKHFKRADQIKVGDRILINIQPEYFRENWQEEANAFTSAEVSSIENFFETDVYDIQTETGMYCSNGILVHNCFIIPVEDNMESILEHNTIEGNIFKGGSGAGCNVSKLRGAGEKLSNKGTSSGSLSFMKMWDSTAGVIKSGGKCLAPWQKVYTNEGPIEVKDLALKESFYTLSYDPPAGRYKMKKAKAWKQEIKKEVLEIVTDKGKFHTTADHPIKINGTGEYRLAKDLKKGNSLFQCSIDKPQDYLRIHLRDGNKGKELLHRMIAKDILNKDGVVHHKDGNKLNNKLDNIEIITQAEHARKHAESLVSKGEHVFQTKSFDTSGFNNGMHKDNTFWKDEEKVKNLKEKHSKNIQGLRAKEMQEKSTFAKMLNFGYQLINKGYNISTYESYFNARLKESNSKNIGIGKTKLLEKIKLKFGSYENFYQELRANNHEVISIASLGEMEVFSIEVDCPTKDDKSPNTGHNYVIWPNDNSTGSGITVSNTRRSAKMIEMDVDHPDILDFIECKKIEEDKAKILISNGVSPEEAYSTVAYQNTNHSIRVTDEFMNAVLEDKDWNLINRGDKKITKTIKAKELLKKAANIAWETGDPGIQFDSTMNKNNPIPSVDKINGTNPCSEFCAIDNSSCNLASLNLLKYYKPEDKEIDNPEYFDWIQFGKDIFVLITAMDILVEAADYPTKEIRDITIKTRPLGLGFSNLGALLMIMGLPYDSQKARNIAKNITMSMTWFAYKQSIKLGSMLGSFELFNDNLENNLRIIEELTLDKNIAESARSGLRNSQVTLLAPTGTISFLMDCDTTGIEPLFALQSIKTLAGGGTMRIDYPCVKKAILSQFNNYDDRMELEYYTKQNPKLFQTANEIPWKAHVDMMTACQKHLNGAISKTINFNSSATKEEVYESYIYAWKQGLKCIAIYRDGSKGMQPIKDANKKEDKPVENKLEQYIPTRLELPDDHRSITHVADINGHKFRIVAGLYPDGSLGEVLLIMSKEGSMLSGVMNGLARIVSLAIQHGVPLVQIIDQFTNMNFEPNGVTRNRDIMIAKSILDYLGRWLKIKFIDNRQNDDDDDYDELEEKILTEHITNDINNNVDYSNAGTCINCGGITIPNGSCTVCTSCGETTGCS